MLNSLLNASSAWRETFFGGQYVVGVIKLSLTLLFRNFLLVCWYMSTLQQSTHPTDACQFHVFTLVFHDFQFTKSCLIMSGFEFSSVISWCKNSQRSRPCRMLLVLTLPYENLTTSRSHIHKMITQRWLFFNWPIFQILLQVRPRQGPPQENL